MFYVGLGACYCGNFHGLQLMTFEGLIDSGLWRAYKKESFYGRASPLKRIKGSTCQFQNIPKIPPSTQLVIENNSTHLLMHFHILVCL